MTQITMYELSKLSAMPRQQEWVGYVYAVEFGKYVKIGYTNNPRRRMKQLEGMANYNNCKIKHIILSEAHTNYKQNEHLLHCIFQTKRLEHTELFDITLEQAASAIDKLSLNKNVEFLRQRAEKSLEQLKKCLRGNEIHENEKLSANSAPYKFEKTLELDDIDINMNFSKNQKNEIYAQVEIETFYQNPDYGNELLLMMNQNDLSNLILSLIELSSNMSAIILNNKNK